MKRNTVKVSESQYEKDMNGLNRYKEDFERSIQSYNITIDKHKSSLQNLKKMRTDFTKESEQIRAENRKREEYLRRYAQSLEDLTQGKISISNCEEEIQVLLTNIKTIQGEMTELNGQKTSYQQKLPILEKEKKDFAATRNFKVKLL